MGCILIDTRTIKGAYIDRAKNQQYSDQVSCTYEKKEATVYKWKKQGGQEAEVKEDLTRGRIAKKATQDDELEGIDLLGNGAKSKSNDDMAIVQLTLQVKSNLRLLVQSKEYEDLYHGSDPTAPNLVEYHRVTFERFYRLP